MKNKIVLFGVVGLLLGLTGCGKESGMEERNNSSEAAGMSEVQNEIQTGAVEVPMAEGNYYEGEYVTIPETDAMEMIAVSKSRRGRTHLSCRRHNSMGA